MKRILLVDDDVELCEMLAEYLQPEGFRVHAVHDGENAVERALAERFDVIVLDVMLPGLSGFEVLQRLRARSRTPVLMLTARGDDVDRIVGLEMGADDYLPKPCNPRELVARLRAILRRSAGPQEKAGEPLAIDDVTLRPEMRSVVQDGRTLPLTSTEYNVLEILLRDAGRVVTKERLSEGALGRTLTRYDRSLDMHVSNLRRKLGPRPGGGERIRTVRGVGYLYCRSG